MIYAPKCETWAKASKLAHYLKDLRKSTTSQLESLFEDILLPFFFRFGIGPIGQTDTEQKVSGAGNLLGRHRAGSVHET